MDEALNNQNSNSNDSMSSGTMGSFYESVLRKVTSVFKSRTSSMDGVKQLEELWESISAMRQQQHLNNNQSVESSTGVKRDASKMTSTSSSPSTLTSQAKKPKLTTPTATQAKTNATVKSNGTSSNSNGKTVVPTTKQPKATTTANNSMNNTRKETSSLVGDEITVFSSSIMTTPSLNDSADQIYDLNSVVDDVSCFTCKKFNQESNNKLVECRKCTKWFHQQCHTPRIEDSQIETDSLADNSLLSASSYFSQCQMCSAAESSRRVLTEPEIIAGEDSKSILVKKNSDESKSDVNSTVMNNNNGVKGLAALANKFNSVVPPKLSSQLSEDNKANQDDLFKKFKQATTNMGSTTASGAKKQLNGSATSSTSANSCSMSSSVKKSVFNMNSNTLPLKSPNQLIATSTKK